MTHFCEFLCSRVQVYTLYGYTDNIYQINSEEKTLINGTMATYDTDTHLNIHFGVAEQKRQEN